MEHKNKENFYCWWTWFQKSIYFGPIYYEPIVKSALNAFLRTSGGDADAVRYV
jgi:hypothetical protein